MHYVQRGLFIVMTARVRLHLLPLPFEGQDLPFRQADKHMHMHARIDEALRLPDQQEWDVRD
jgi:hypothetical protein